MAQFLAERSYASVSVLGDSLRFSYATNAGAAFGVLQQQTSIFVLAAVIVLPAIVYIYGTLTDEPWYIKLSLGLLLGGTLGNFVDRLRTGYVVDFIDAGIGSARWPSFNIADSSFVVGTIVIAAYIIFAPHKERAEEAPRAKAPDGTSED